MDAIDLLEHGGGHFHVRHQGVLVPLADPRAKHYQWVLMALALRFAPGTPGDIPDWKREVVFDRWCAAWGLPPFSESRRLAYLVDNYRAALSHDLAIIGLDLGELWRARRSMLLLDVIDRLPAHSWYASSVAMDEEHAKMMAEAIEQRGGKSAEDSGPSLTTWTPEVAALHNIFDAVRSVQHAVIAVQHGSKAGEPPKPAPRPVTALEKALRSANRRRRQAEHESLVARLIPNRGATPPPAAEPPPEPAPEGPSPADVARVLARKKAVES
jgi:hypothetical protein